MRRRIFSEDHDLFREAVSTFMEREVKPYQEGWNEEGIVAREAWRKAGEAGAGTFPWEAVDIAAKLL